MLAFISPKLFWLSVEVTYTEGKNQAQIYNEPLNDFSQQMANISHVGSQLLFASFIFIYLFIHFYLFIHLFY